MRTACQSIKLALLIGIVFALVPFKAGSATTVCLGEAVSGRAISHSGKGDSAIAPNGDNCFFFIESPIGRQIEKECPIRDIGLSDEPGPICRVEAVVSNQIIRRVIGVTKLRKRNWAGEPPIAQERVFKKCCLDAPWSSPLNPLEAGEFAGFCRASFRTLTITCITVITRIAPAARFSQAKTIAVARPRLPKPRNPCPH